MDKSILWTKPLAAFAQIIDGLLPTALLKQHNPYFERQFKRLRWPPSRMSSQFVPINKMMLIRRYTYMGGLVAFVVSVPLIATMSDTYWMSYVEPIMLFVFVVSLTANIIYTVTAVNSTVAEVKAEQWDLLRLTSLSEEDILVACHAAIQIRVWRVTVIESVLRLIIGLMTVAYFIYNLIHYRTGGVFYIMLFLVPLVTTTGYVLEPLWRMRAVTLFAMTIAAQFRDYGIAVLVAFAGTIGLIILEAIAVACLSIVISAAPTLTYASSTLSLIVFVIRVVIFMAGLFLFFRTINRFLFQRLKHFAFRS